MTTVNQVVALLVAILAMGIVATGIAYMFRGPAGAKAVLAWEWRLVRRLIGGLFALLGKGLVTFGNWIRK